LISQKQEVDMRKAFAIAVLMMFVLGSVPVMAEQAAPAKGKPMSKTPGESTFQAAAAHISKWGKSAPIAAKCSLRGNKAELAKRNQGKCCPR
jgi:hypothetical protein